MSRWTIRIGGVMAHVLFDSGATHSFVSQEMVAEGRFKAEPMEYESTVRSAGGHALETRGIVRDIPVYIGTSEMPVDLIVIPLEKHELILGMDWLGRNKATINCFKCRVKFERNEGIVEFQGIRPISGSLVVSDGRAEQMLSKNCEAYVATITRNDGSFVLQVDYGGLNRVTMKIKYPLPRIDQQKYLSGTGLIKG